MLSYVVPSRTLATQQPLGNEEQTNPTNQHRINVTNSANERTQDKRKGKPQFCDRSSQFSYSFFVYRFSYLLHVFFLVSSGDVTYVPVDAKTFFSAIAFYTIYTSKWQLRIVFEYLRQTIITRGSIHISGHNKILQKIFSSVAQMHFEAMH